MLTGCAVVAVGLARGRPAWGCRIGCRAGLQALGHAERGLRLPTAMAVPVMVVAFALHVPFELAFRAQLPAEPVLQQVGEYLGEHVAPGEAVSAEPAGYIGFYSRATLYDYPGLTSKVALRQPVRRCAHQCR